ncbi:MAG: trimethylamine methyltransferase family protein, partial [Bacteroidota bacterium]
FQQRPFGEVRNRLPPTELVSADQIEAIHEASLTVLRDIGLKIESAVARDLLQKAGAEVAEDRVNRLTRLHVLHTIS